MKILQTYMFNGDGCACFFEQINSNRGSNDVRHTLISSSIARRRCLFLLLISMSAENPNSQSQDDANGRRILIAFILSKGYVFTMDNQKSCRFSSEKLDR